MIIYKTTNKINGKIYIGQDINNNKSYLGSGVYLRNAFKKYGRKNFTKEILQKCNTIEELNEAEIFWIKTLDSTNKNIGYNLALGGFGCFGTKRKLTDEIKQKISTANKGNKSKLGQHISDITKEKIGNANRGRKMSDEFKEKRRLYMLGNTLRKHKKLQNEKNS